MAVRGVVMLILLAPLLVGCAKSGKDIGPYADAKQSWDPPRTTEQLSMMRTRLATTQQDH
jgi:hypothetical protein